ncbi:DNA cytosine methyltransferase [Paenibacillus larvae]|nr:DNA cytosine methyltransferase [Paenibacillus larvae]
MYVHSHGRFLEQDGIITRNRTIDLISAGYPCQPFSNAGEAKTRKMTVTSGQKLLESYRKSGPIGSLVRMLLGTYLWGSMTCYLTESIGYDTQAIIIPACAVGAPPRRDKSLHFGVHRVHQMQWEVTGEDKGSLFVQI